MTGATEGSGAARMGGSRMLDVGKGSWGNSRWLSGNIVVKLGLLLRIAKCQQGAGVSIVLELGLVWEQFGSSRMLGGIRM